MFILLELDFLSKLNERMGLFGGGDARLGQLLWLLEGIGGFVIGAKSWLIRWSLESFDRLKFAN